MVEILAAKSNAIVLLDEISGEPRMIVTDASPVYMKQLRETVGLKCVDIPIDIYNYGMTNPDGAHVDAVNYAMLKNEEAK